MAYQEVTVNFKEKYIAALSGLKWNDAEKKWLGSAKAIRAFEENKKKAEEYLKEKKIDPSPQPEPKEIQASLWTKEEWENLLSEETKTIPIIEAIHDFALPLDRQTRILLLRRLSEKRNGDYPVYYHDIARYCPAFAERYNEEKINDLIQSNKLSGREIIKELAQIPLDEEDRALLFFVFS